MRAVGIALLLAVSATIARAEGDPLAEAIRLEAALDYQQALVIVEREIARGAADRERLVTLHVFAGKLAAGLDRPAIAEDHFARALALAPSTTFAAGTSPKITQPFDAARARTTPLRVAASVENGVVTLTLGADPNHLVDAMAVVLDSGRELRERGRLRIELPPGSRAVQISALDMFGNRVWSEAAPVTAARAEPTTTTTLRPLYARWPVWATGTVVALAAGGVCAWRFDTAQSEWNRLNATGDAEFGELRDIETRGKRWALAANVSFGVAATTTLIAIITAARGSQTTTIVTARPDAVGLAIGGSF